MAMPKISSSANPLQPLFCTVLKMYWMQSSMFLSSFLSVSAKSESLAATSSRCCSITFLNVSDGFMWSCIVVCLIQIDFVRECHGSHPGCQPLSLLLIADEGDLNLAVRSFLIFALKEFNLQCRAQNLLD